MHGLQLSEVLKAQGEDELFAFTSGPRDAHIILVGEAWGSEEHAARRPFVGHSGKELDRILSDAGLKREEILCTNLVSARPPANDFTHFIYPTKEKVNAEHIRGVECRPELALGYRRLHRLIAHVNPALVIVAGNWPLWALTNHAEVTTTAGFRTPKGITKWRGSQTYSIPISRQDSTDLRSESGVSYPVLPILHPAAILREWGWRAITVHDLRRAARYLKESSARQDEYRRRRSVGTGESSSNQPQQRDSGLRVRDQPGWYREPSTFTLHKPSYWQINHRLTQWRRELDAGSELWLACDLETYKRKYISVIGLADDKLELCIPLFTVKDGKLTSYLTLEQECWVFAELREILEHPNARIIGQNFIYDTEWFHRYYHINAIVAFDTMVAHHLLFPGTPKRLDYLSSLYCKHYLYWKDESWDLDGDIGEHTWKYNCKDLRATYEIATVLRATFAANKELEALYAFQMEQWKLSRSTMLQGVAFDSSLQKAMRLQLLEAANLLSDWLLSAVPSQWQYTSTQKPWYDSPKGTADLLYTALGLNPVLHKKTKRPTTDDAALAELSERTSSQWLKPLFDRLRHLRSLGVFTSNFLDARTSPDGRIRCSFNIAHPETFRWSSNSNGFGEGTNLQNIPKGDKEEIALNVNEMDPARAESLDNPL